MTKNFYTWQYAYDSSCILECGFGIFGFGIWECGFGIWQAPIRPPWPEMSRKLESPTPPWQESFYADRDNHFV